MASGNTLAVFTPLMAEFPASNYATLDARNNHPVLDFDQTTQETVFFTAIMPRHYANGGVTVYVYFTSDVTSGTAGWDASFERMADGGHDIDADDFATAQTITAETVPGTSGVLGYANVAITNGANMDSVVAGDAFRLRIRRDTADSAAGDNNLVAVEIKET